MGIGWGKISTPIVFRAFCPARGANMGQNPILGELRQFLNIGRVVPHFEAFNQWMINFMVIVPPG